MDEFLQKNKLTISLALIGVILIGLGALRMKSIELGGKTEIEILGDSDQENVNKEKFITLEIAGEVLKPGVYTLPEGSRINDLLIAGGGLSAGADRDWVAKYLNLAQRLTDGTKIYIPEKKEKSTTEVESSDNQLDDKTNINLASEAELDKLPGIGPVTAQKIISGRPYLTTDELLKKKIVKSNVWETIKDQIVVY